MLRNHGNKTAGAAAQDAANVSRAKVRREAPPDPLFEVAGTHEIEVRQGPGGLFFDRDSELRKLRNHSVARRCGVYIFCTIGRRNKLTPWYVGKATKTFAQEVFSIRNEALFLRALRQGGERGAKIYLLAPEQRRGKPNVSAIGRMETYLIQQCSLKNDDLLNKQNRKFFLPRIRGVMNSPQGKPSKLASQLRDLLL